MTAVSLVVAVSRNGVIGRGGTLPWHLPDDLKHFKAVTLGHPILMGRVTQQSIGRALPGRRNLVLSRQRTDAGWPQGVEAVGSLAEALQRVQGAAELCVIGGAQVYRLAMQLASRVHLTLVHGDIVGDTYFPLVQLTASDGWREVSRVEHAVDERHAYPMSFVTLEREVPVPSGGIQEAG